MQASSISGKIPLHVQDMVNGQATNREAGHVGLTYSNLQPSDTIPSSSFRWRTVMASHNKCCSWTRTHMTSATFELAMRFQVLGLGYKSKSGLSTDPELVFGTLTERSLPSLCTHLHTNACLPAGRVFAEVAGQQNVADYSRRKRVCAHPV